MKIHVSCHAKTVVDKFLYVKPLKLVQSIKSNEKKITYNYHSIFNTDHFLCPHNHARFFDWRYLRHIDSLVFYVISPLYLHFLSLISYSVEFNA